MSDNTDLDRFNDDSTGLKRYVILFLVLRSMLTILRRLALGSGELKSASKV
jgi:hypothetical protein